MELTSVALFAVFIFLLVLLALVLKRLGRNDLNITSSSLEGKTIIVTGAEQGRGIHITLELAKRKARVIMACADENKGKTARQKVVQRTGNTNVVVQHLDSATKGARSVLFCALDDSVQTGGYYIDGQLMDHTPSVPASVYDEGLAKKLWEVSERLTGQSDVMGELNARLAKRGRVE